MSRFSSRRQTSALQSNICWALICCVGTSGLWPLTARAAANQIGAVEVQKDGANRTVRIKTTVQPTFTVFRLSDPMRVVVDISGGELGDLHGPQVVEDGVIGQIALRQFRSEGFIIGRVIIGFEKESLYDVQTDGNAVVLRATPTRAKNVAKVAAQPMEVPTHAATAQPSLSAAPVAAPSATATKASQEGSAPQAQTSGNNDSVNESIHGLPMAAPSTTLTGVQMAGPGQFFLRLDGAAAAYTSERLSDPARLVIDLPQTTRRTSALNYGFASKVVKRVRLGDQTNGTRVVFDLPNESLTSQVKAVTGGVLVALQKPQNTPTPAIKEPAEGPNSGNKSDKSDKAEAPDPSGAATLSSVHFSRGPDDTARITLRLTGDAHPQLDQQSDKAWVLTLENTHVASGQERSLDASALKTVVRMVSTYQSAADAVHVVANLTGPAKGELRRAGGLLIWEIAGTAVHSPPLVAQRAISSVAAPRTAGFVGEAAAFARSTPTQERDNRRRISLDVKDADIVNVLRLISEETGENIIASDDVKGKVTLKLRNVPADQALDTMLRTKGFDKVRQNNILRIAPAEVIQKERDLELAKKRSQAEVEETLIKMVTVNYASAAEIIDQIKPLLTGRGSVQVDTRTNTIILQDIASNVDRVVELTRRLDKQTPLVMIQARIVEASTNYLQDLGVQWGGESQETSRTGNPTGLAFPGDIVTSGGADDATRNQVAGVSTPAHYAVNLPANIAGSGGSLGFILGSAGGSQILNLRLSALEQTGSAKIISSPEVATLDNKTALVSQGVDIPISVVSAAGTNTRFVSAALKLEVTPHVTNDGTVLLKIKTEKSEPDFGQKGGAGDPTIQKKFAETEVLVRDGDTSVIGGIYTRNTAESLSEVPFFARIPILGNLFRQRRKSDARAELLVFITPRIINRDESTVPNNTFETTPARTTPQP